MKFLTIFILTALMTACDAVSVNEISPFEKDEFLETDLLDNEDVEIENEDDLQLEENVDRTRCRKYYSHGRAYKKVCCRFIRHRKRCRYQYYR